MDTQKKPILAVMVGVSGSGKSTYGNGLKTSLKLSNGLDTKMVSTDDIRGELCNGDMTDQSKNGEVFSTARNRVSNGLKQGNNVIIDATSLTRKDRKLWIDIGKMNGAEVRAYFIETPVALAKKRNAGRSRVVPDFVIDKQLAKLAIPHETEGFDSVTTIRS